MKDSITGVPADQVGRVVQDFIDDGSTTVMVEKNEDGTYRVSAS